MLINLNEDILRQIIREAVKDNVTYKWANMDIDYPAKGRTAKKISKDEFEEHLKDFYEKYCRDDDYWRGKYDRNKRLKPSTFINGALKYNKKIPKKLRDDLNEIEHDEENMEAIGDIQITNGIPYIQGCVGGDWESAIFFVLYWDGKDIRGYIPTKGNSFDRFRKIALGNDDEKDIEFLERVRCKPSDGTHSVNYNKEECLKDFKHRIGVLK